MRVGDVFFDANVLLYVHDLSGTEKVGIASRWVSELSLYAASRTNLQVLNEVANVLQRKRKDLSNEAVFDIIDNFTFLGSNPSTWNEVTMARQLRSTTRYSWWDCLLLASAIELGCSHFLSEDLQDGHQIGGLTIINPFLHAPETILGPLQD
jgi:predicted nucleic acid-binding protein